MPASRIEVEVAGTSASLQEATAKAADALVNLGDVLAAQAKRSAAASDQILEGNQKVGDSFENALGKVRASTAGMTESMAGTGDASTAYAGKMADAGGRIMESASATAGRIVETTATTRDAYAEQAAAIGEAADKMAAASDRMAGSADRVAEASVAASHKSKTAAADSAIGFGAASSKITKAGRDILLTAAAVGAGSIVMSAKFNASTLRLQTQAGATAGQLAKLRTGMLNLSGETGFHPDQLATGMYHVVSSMNAMIPKSQRVRVELQVLKTAAEGAQVGGSDLEDTSYALASAMNALHAKTSDSGKVMGELNAIVGSGDMTMQDLLASLKSGLIPTAQTSGVSLQSLGSALAVMGDMGQRGALAGTRLRMAMGLLAGPSEAAAKILNTVGLTSKQATSDQAAMAAALKDAGLRTTSLSGDLHKPDGILAALEDLKKHLKDAGVTSSGTAAIMIKAFGGGRTGAGIEELANNTDRLHTKFVQIGHDAGQFGGDWQKTQQTLRVEADKTVGALAATGTKLGTDFTPYVKDALKDLRDLATWFEKNHTELDILGGAVATFATVAIGSYMVSKVKEATKLIKEFGSAAQTTGRFVGKAFGAGSSSSSTPTGAAGSGASSATVNEAANLQMDAAKMQLDAARMMLEAAGKGELGGGGGSSFSRLTNSGSSTTTTAVGEAESAVPMAEEEGIGAVAGTTLLTKLKAGLPDVMEGAMKGGMIALGGTAISQILKTVIGGKAGNAVGTIGTDASIGGGVGMMLGPEGAVAGGLGGAAFGALQTLFNSGPSPTEKLKELDAEIKAAAGDDNVALLQKLGQQAQDTGQQLADSAKNAQVGWGNSADTIKQQSDQAQQFEDTAKTVAAAVQDMSNTMSGPLEQALEQTAQYGFPKVKAAMDDTQLSVEQKSQLIITNLKQIASEGAGPMSVNARQAFEQLSQAITIDLTQATNQATGTMHQLTLQVQDGSSGAAQAVYQNFENLDTNIRSAMGDGALSVSEGAKLIARALNAALKAFGAKPIPENIEAIAVSQNLGPGVSLSSPNTLHVGGAASGAMVQYGQPGAKGRDNILTNIGGQNLAVGAGEVGMVMTRHQQSVANTALSGVGGLPGLFSNVTTPHYMARGGFVPGYASGGIVEGYSQLEGLWKQAGGPASMAGLMAAIAEAESGGRSTAQNPSGASGLWQILGVPFPGNVFDPLTNARMAVAKWRSQGLGAWATYTSGAYKQFLHGGAGGAGGALQTLLKAPHVTGSGTLSTMAQSALGIATQAANEYLSNAAPAASTGGGGGAAGSGGGAPSVSGGTVTPSASWNPDRKPIASWIVPILQWASQHGWHGYVTSGYRTPAEEMQAAQQYAARVGKPVSELYAGGSPLNSNHLKTSYPGGAVDVDGGSEMQLIAVLRGYKGLDSIVGGDLGPGDPYHFSHTGMSLGGLIRAATGFGGKETIGPPKVVKPPKTPKAPKPGSRGKASGTGLTTADMQELAAVGGKLGSLENQLTVILGGTSGEGEYNAESSRYSAVEAQAKFLNADGSMNAAGYAQMVTDDSSLISLQSTALSDYQQELGLVTKHLRKYLSEQTSDNKLIQTDAATLQADALRKERNTAKISANKIKELGVRKSLDALSKPTKDTVQKLQDQINAATLKYGAAVTAAEKRKAAYRGNNTTIKDQLEAAVETAEATEQAALEPLKEQKLAATVAQQKRAAEIKSEKFTLNQQLKSLGADSTRLEVANSKIADLATRTRDRETKTKGQLTGTNGTASVNKQVSLMETIAAKLGIVEWGHGGIFKGIDTSKQGAIYDTKTTLMSLRNSKGQAQSDESTAGTDTTADQSQLITLLEQQNANLAEQASVQTNQENVISGMLSGLVASVPHFATGGPVLDDTLAQVHKNEFVVPEKGQLVMRGGESQPAAAPQVNVENNFHGHLGALVDLIDSRVTHPNNVRAISRTMGQRSQMLSHSAAARAGLRR